MKDGEAAFADIDNDSDQDLLMTGYNNFSKNKFSILYSNDGKGKFSKVEDTPFEAVDKSTVDFTDIDSDGDMDVMITGQNSSSIAITQLYRNDGLGNFIIESDLEFEGISGGAVDFADIDNDQDQDVIMSGFNNSRQYTTKLFRNNTIPCHQSPPLDVTTTLNNSTIMATNSNATYQWLLCDPYSIIQGETSQVFDFPQDGIYAVILTENKCSDTSDCINTTIVATKKTDIDLISIYPNPISEQLTFQTEAEGICHIHELNGNLVWSDHLQAGKTIIQTTDLEKGIYLLRFQSDADLFIKKIIIK